jgi:hypothetical protein
MINDLLSLSQREIGNCTQLINNALFPYYLYILIMSPFAVVIFRPLDPKMACVPVEGLSYAF